MSYLGVLISLMRCSQDGRQFLSFLPRSSAFNETEIAYCIDRKNPSIHFAGRFAAKEALKKAILSQNPDAIIPLKSLSIERLESGEPTVEYDAPLDCKVSISHTEEFAIAFALVRPKQ